jgi:hypothetical protein
MMRICQTLSTAFIATTLTLSNAHAIVGGMDSRDPDGARRYTVGLITSSRDICSGVVIAPDLVLTAAHCLAKGKPREIMALSPDFRPRYFTVAKFWRNPQFILGKRPLQQKGADLALIALAAPLPADMVPISIASSTRALLSSSSLMIAGFGVTRYGDAASAGLLREAPLIPVGIGHLGAISLLASADGRIGSSPISACLGDSGGPVTVRDNNRDVLVGIISWVGSQRGAKVCEGVTVASPTLLSDESSRESLYAPPAFPTVMRKPASRTINDEQPVQRPIAPRTHQQFFTRDPAGTR